MMTRSEKIEKVIREWDQWSPAEQARMDEIVDSYIRFAADGIGNRFMRETWKRHFASAIDALS
jgi:hypothetical protein